MAHEETDWEPTGVLVSYDGYDCWDRTIGPHEINTGEVDGDVEFDDDPAVTDGDGVE